MNEFLTGDVWNKVNRLVRASEKKIACIAYVTSNNLKLNKGDILICNASDARIKFGETSAAVLDYYFKKGVTLHSIDSLHSKLLLTNGLLVVGSANLSKNSAEKLTESAIATSNKVLISQTKSFCHNLMRESRELSRVDINRLLKIKVVKRPVSAVKKTQTRDKEFGNSTWFVQVFPLKDGAAKRVEETVAKNNKIIAKEEGMREDDIGFIEWPGKSTFANSLKEGDQIILKWTSHKKSRSYLFPSTAVLRVQKNGRYKHIYYDNSEDRAMAWSKAEKLLRHKLPKKTRKLLSDEVTAINGSFD